ncbi:MAG TPA: beta galactosidase jelly roll domain-containing protein [Prolixibacteraceae bacterium]|nr:beta galactosidase jelly roll domain-containing protein [Prolixibacteraceae bacterium]
MRIIPLLVVLLFIQVQFSFAQDKNIKQEKLTRFELQSSELIHATGELISTSGYQSNVYWFPVNVPSTVLTGLVANRVYPDPYSGMNNMLIPDASDEFNKTYNLEQYSHIPNVGNPWKKPYWYRTTFKVPAADKGRHFQLIFKGINYRAAVWMNGQPIADSTQMVGMFAEYSFDVSSKIKSGEENVLAVKIYPLDYPGLPAPEQLKAMGDFFLNGGPTGDIGKNVTMMCAVGWDWVPPVRDRNMGIWQPVYLRTSGDVTIVHPQLITDLPNLPDTSVAKLSLNLTLSNHSKTTTKGNLKISIRPENFSGDPISFSKEITIAANSGSLVELNTGNTDELQVKHPRLWWPNGYGTANLYRIQLQFETDGLISDDTTFVFGIRTVSSKAVEVPNKSLRRDFYVNGKRVNLVGGAWVPDMMLNRDSARYDSELHLCRNANVNLVRIWGGGITPPDIFFDLADRYGLMVWSDFWVTGDTHGEFKGSKSWPLEGNVFINNVISTIYRIRNHPSLLLWTGGNEGHIRKDVYDRMRESVINLDGTRPFIPSSSGFAKLPEGWKGSWPDNKASGVYSGGPYAWQDSREYYRLADNAKDWVFKDETGLPSQPPYNSLIKIIPNLVWDSKLPFPLNNSWGYHDAATGNGKYDKYYETMVTRYGEPSSMEDFSDKMQFMNATGYQGTFEAAGHKLNENGGVMLWKLNAAFPSVIWQIYDWYLEPNAGYYFMQNACEPVHAQLNALDYNVTVVNRTHHPVSNLTIQADVFDMDSKLIFHKTEKITLTSTDVKEPFSLSKVLTDAKGVNFVVLNLKDANGKVISHNVYWLAADDNYKALNTMSVSKLETIVLKSETVKSDTRWTVQFTNNTKHLALFIRPQLLSDGEEVLPCFWSASYFSLAPGESITVTTSVSSDQLKSKNQEIQIKGWNMEDRRVSLK